MPGKRFIEINGATLSPSYKVPVYGLSFEKKENEDKIQSGTFLSPPKEEIILTPRNDNISRLLVDLSLRDSHDDSTSVDSKHFSPALSSDKNNSSYNTASEGRTPRSHRSNTGNSSLMIPDSFASPAAKPGDESLELHFDYRSRRGRNAYKSWSEGTLGTVESDTNTSEDESCCMLHIHKPSMTEILLEQRLHDRKFPKFIKFIPVEFPIPLQIPKILHNQSDMTEWEEAQQAYEKIQLKTTKSSLSDDSFLSKRSSAMKKGLKKILPKKMKEKMRMKKNQKRAEESLSSSDCLITRPKLCEERFSGKINLEYIAVNAKRAPKFSAQLYAMIIDEENYAMCHVKTELLASCLETFLYPNGEIQCLWVNNLPSMIQQLTKDTKLKPLLRKLVILKQFKAALVLSSEASKLIRHKDTCFLRSLTTVLQIPHNKLLVLRSLDETEV